MKTWKRYEDWVYLQQGPLSFALFVWTVLPVYLSVVLGPLCAVVLAGLFLSQVHS